MGDGLWVVDSRSDKVGLVRNLNLNNPNLNLNDNEDGNLNLVAKSSFLPKKYSKQPKTGIKNVKMCYFGGYLVKKEYLCTQIINVWNTCHKKATTSS